MPLDESMWRQNCWVTTPWPGTSLASLLVSVRAMQWWQASERELWQFQWLFVLIFFWMNYFGAIIQHPHLQGWSWLAYRSCWSRKWCAPQVFLLHLPKAHKLWNRFVYLQNSLICHRLIDMTFAPGAAYVFYLDGSDGTWKQEAQLLASDAESLDRFGGTIDISDTTVTWRKNSTKQTQEKIGFKVFWVDELNVKIYDYLHLKLHKIYWKL